VDARPVDLLLGEAQVGDVDDTVEGGQSLSDVGGYDYVAVGRAAKEAQLG
jgi:hypothetical protein